MNLFGTASGHDDRDPCPAFTEDGPRRATRRAPACRDPLCGVRVRLGRAGARVGQQAVRRRHGCGMAGKPREARGGRRAKLPRRAGREHARREQHRRVRGHRPQAFHHAPAHPGGDQHQRNRVQPGRAARRSSSSTPATGSPRRSFPSSRSPRTRTPIPEVGTSGSRSTMATTSPWPATGSASSTDSA